MHDIHTRITELAITNQEFAKTPAALSRFLASFKGSIRVISASFHHLLNGSSENGGSHSSGYALGWVAFRHHRLRATRHEVEALQRKKDRRKFDCTIRAIVIQRSIPN